MPRLIESSSKNKSQYDRISLTTTPAQKMELKERAKDADEISLSRWVIKILKKHGYLTFLIFTISAKFSSILKILAKEKLFEKSLLFQRPFLKRIGNHLNTNLSILSRSIFISQRRSLHSISFILTFSNFLLNYPHPIFPSFPNSFLTSLLYPLLFPTYSIISTLFSSYLCLLKTYFLAFLFVF